MSGPFLVVWWFLISGTIATLIVSRLFRVALTLRRFMASFSVAAVSGIAVASAVAWIKVKASCHPGQTCGYTTYVEDGMYLAGVWIGCCGITYLVSAIVVALIQRRQVP